MTDDVRAALLLAAIPLEALHADNLDGSTVIVPSLREHIATAVDAIRTVLTAAPQDARLTVERLAELLHDAYFFAFFHRWERDRWDNLREAGRVAWRDGAEWLLPRLGAPQDAPPK